MNYMQSLFNFVAKWAKRLPQVNFQRGYYFGREMGCQGAHHQPGTVWNCAPIMLCFSHGKMEVGACGNDDEE